METSRSSRTVIHQAYALANDIWPSYAHRFSRHDFTLPQLFACLVVREMLQLSYRKCEDFLRDAREWLADIGMSRPPDHNTLWRAFGVLIAERHVRSMLELMSEHFQKAR
ncbi:MAG: transposase [Tepidisphaeraceae bacterium]|jgi:hypothetical protein